MCLLVLIVVIIVVICRPSSSSSSSSPTRIAYPHRLPASYPHQVSDGGVHSHLNHLKALLRAAKDAGVPKTFVHFFGDGRDTSPKSATTYLKDLLAFMEELKVGRGWREPNLLPRLVWTTGHHYRSLLCHGS